MSAPASLPLVLDGAVGTALMARLGLALGDLARTPVDSLVLTHGETVRGLHAEYVAAGAGAVHTDTFGATSPRLARAGLAARAGEINREAVRLARAAAAGRALVIGDLGPLGAPEIEPAVRLRAYAEQVEALAGERVDWLHAETMIDPDDVAAALRACSEHAPRVPRMVSFALIADPAVPDGFRVPGGASLADLVRAARHHRPAAFGLTCSLAPAEMARALPLLRSLVPPGIALFAQPCAGIPPAPLLTPEAFAAGAAALRNAGATTVAGCCGTTPAHIAALTRALSERRTMKHEHPHEHVHDHIHAGSYDRFGNPEDLAAYVARLESPDRAEWQHPDEVIAALGVSPGQTVGEIGAGPGFFTLRLARAAGPAGRIYAADVESRILAILRQRLEAAAVDNVTPVLAAATDPCLPSASCDRILTVNTFHHFPDPIDYLRRLARVLRPGGRLALVDFHRRETPVGPPVEHRVAREDVLAHAAAAGLALLEEPTFLPHQYFLLLAPRPSGA